MPSHEEEQIKKKIVLFFWIAITGQIISIYVYHNRKQYKEMRAGLQKLRQPKKNKNVAQY